MTSEGRILVVDDSEESLKLLSEILSSAGYDVRPADSGELALAAAAMSPPELIVVDMRMPGMSGLEVCQKLRMREESRDIPVIFLSASHDFEDRIASLESGAVDFLSKPFRREELLARLKTHLELARLRKDLERRVAERTAALQAANDHLENELAARRRVEEELRESEYRFRNMADTIPAGISLFTPERVTVYVSKWFLTFLGCTTEQLAADGWMRFVHPEDRRHVEEETVAAVKEQRSSQMEHRVLRHDGEYRWVAASGTPRFVDGKFVGHVVIVLDITELKGRQQEALANQKLESIGVLTAGIAHDFNNLLSTILAHSDLALDEIASDSPAHDSVATITASAIRASKIVKLLMAYAGYADSGAFEPIDLSSLIEGMVQLLRVTVPRNTSLRVNLSKNVPPIWADAGQLRQVVMNLIMNASEALGTRPGTVTISTSLVRLSQRSAESRRPDLREGDYVVIEVSDTGCGMNEDTQARIFDPFFSTKFLGRGMGLASVQGILRGAGGAIEVKSALGQGSTFKVWLPYSDSAPVGDGGVNRVDSKLAATVLLVDDEEGLRMAVANALTREGFSVLQANGGLDAVELFVRNSAEIDIVVLDMTLPGLSGRDVCEEIRRLKPDVRVLFSSAHNFTEGEGPGGQANQRFLQKPYRLRELIERLREMMTSPDQR